MDNTAIQKYFKILYINRFKEEKTPEYIYIYIYTIIENNFHQSPKIFTGKLLLSSGFLAVLSKVKERFLLIASFVFIPNQGSRDLPKEANPES